MLSESNDTTLKGLGQNLFTLIHQQSQDNQPPVNPFALVIFAHLSTSLNDPILSSAEQGALNSIITRALPGGGSPSITDFLQGMKGASQLIYDYNGVSNTAGVLSKFGSLRCADHTFPATSSELQAALNTAGQAYFNQPMSNYNQLSSATKAYINDLLSSLGVSMPTS